MKVTGPMAAGIVVAVLIVVGLVGYFYLRPPSAPAPTAGAGSAQPGPPAYAGAAEAARQHPAK